MADAPERAAPLNVALVIEHCRPERGGGERYVCDLARGLADRGHAVHVYAAEGAAPDARVTFHRIPAWRRSKWRRKWAFATGSRAALAGGHDVGHAVGKALGFTLLNPHGGVERFWLRQHLRAYEHPVARALAALRRYASPRHYVLTAIERRQFRPPGPAAVIAIADMVRDHLVAEYAYQAARISVIYNGVDLRRFHPGVRGVHREVTRARLSLAPGDLALLFVGNNYRLKGVASLIRATARLRRDGIPARAVVVGRESPGRYRRLAHAEGIADAVAFPGPDPQIERMYAAADVLVHPTWYDACALVTFEAMACGVPVITSRWNGASGILTPGVDGEVLEDPADVAGLSRLIAPYASAGRREQVGAAARKTAERYPVEQNTDRVIEVYRRILAAGSAGDPRMPAITS